MRISKLLPVISSAAAIVVAGVGTAHAAPSTAGDGLLDTPAIDELIAAAENGAAECAAQEWLGGTMLVIAFASDDDATSSGDLGEYPAELLMASYAPVLVPLLQRAQPPSDATAAEVVEVVTGQLVASIDEMRELGFTDEGLLALQENVIASAGDTGDTGELTGDSTPEEAAALAAFKTLIDHDFEAITLLDPDGPLAEIGDAADPTTLWADVCPETAAMFSFDMDPVDVEMDASVVVGGSEPVTNIEVTVNGSEVQPDTDG